MTGEDRGATSAPACAICGKPVDANYKPFCSKRCADVDLHRWLNNAYAIAGAPADAHEDDAPAEQGSARSDFLP